MLIEGINDSDEAINSFYEQLKATKYDKIYINTPVRPPAEKNVQCPNLKQIQKAVDKLSAISIDMLVLAISLVKLKFIRSYFKYL